MVEFIMSFTKIIAMSLLNSPFEEASTCAFSTTKIHLKVDTQINFFLIKRKLTLDCEGAENQAENFLNTNRHLSCIKYYRQSNGR
ncbi:hypothetical protein BpHYR1_037641 [Brachionus plicatilis]|uniref:Uncharacterized protein n=1 Tax=Brachionus plicatilis TaxID=10195 RepID=A0A3M7QPE8_BRAPC|nr:hypothetical protein BpHYR1_037641 [Brachionus plicatilis]